MYVLPEHRRNGRTGPNSNADSSPFALVRPLDELLGVGVPVPDDAAVNASLATTYDPNMTDLPRGTSQGRWEQKRGKKNGKGTKKVRSARYLFYNE
jgi:hypothetical protein